MARGKVLRARSRSSQDLSEPPVSSAPAHASLFGFGGLTLDLLSGCIQRRGTRLALEPRAYDVLVHLVRHAGAVISREALLDTIWQDVHVAPHSLTQAIFQLRQALGDDPRKPRFIETVHRRGYRFVAPVRAMASLPMSAAAIRGTLSQPSVAVLPFADVSAAGDQEWFADGMTDEIINALTRVTGLKVIARTSAFAFRNSKRDVRSIGAILGVGHILEGSVRKAGDRIRITAQLVDASDGSHLTSNQYDGDVTDIFQIQEATARAIASALEVKLLAPSPSSRGSANVAAYELYLEARHHWFNGSLAKFRACLDNALALDPSFALAHSLLGAFYIMSSWTGLQPAHEAMPLARVLESEALRLDSTLPEARALLGVAIGQYDYDWDEAERQFRLAMTRSPVSRDVLFWYGNHYLVPTGRPREAVEAMQRGLEADPLNLLYRHRLALGLRHAGRPDDAERELRKVLELDENYAYALGTLGAVCAEDGRLDEALALTEKAHALTPKNPIVIGQLAALVRQARDTCRADGLIGQLRPGEAYGAPVGLAVYHGMCGEIQPAANWAARAIEQRFPPVVHILGPLLRTSARWSGLAKMMRLTAA
jgi:TolB-like protein